MGKAGVAATSARTWAASPARSSAVSEAVSAVYAELYPPIPPTADELDQMRRLEALGVDGICSNDPRLFAQL